MRESLGKELSRSAQQAARRVAPGIVRLAANQVKDVAKYPSSLYGSEATSAPAVNATRTLTRRPLVAGTLRLYNASTGAEYAPGSAFTEDARNGAFMNLTIPSGASLTAHYHHYKGGGSGSTMTDQQVLDALNRTTGAVSDAALGNRTVDQAFAGPANTGPLTSLLSWLAGRIKDITGELDWKNVPATTLKSAKAHMDRLDNPHGTTAAQIGAQAILDQAKTVDGSGSGLDADLLDGVQGSGYATAAHLHDDRYKQLVSERIAERPATDAASTYPLGTSIMEVATAAGWPAATGAVETLRYSDGRTVQFFSQKNGTLVRMRWWNEVSAAWSSFATPNVADFAAASHVGSRAGHPLATATLDGMMAGADKAKLDGLSIRTSKAPTFTQYSLPLAAATWTRLSPSAEVYEPHIDIPILGAPPTGYKWQVLVAGTLRVTPDVATDAYIGAGIGTSWTLGGGSMIAGMARTNAGHQFIPLGVALDIADPTVANVVTFSIQTFPGSTTTVQTTPLPTGIIFLGVA